MFKPAILVSALLLTASAGRADVPNTITYQGRLTKSGISAAGPHTFQACIKAASGGPCLWNGSYSKTLPPSGDFTLVLEIDTPIDWINTPVQLELRVNGTLLTPSDDFTAVPYALVASTAVYALTSAAAQTALGLSNDLPASEVLISGVTHLDLWRSTSTPAKINAAMIDGSLSGQWTTGAGGVLYHTGGSVGVGTSVPGAKLSIVDPVIPTLHLRRDASNEWFLSASATGGHRLGFRANGTSDANEMLTFLTNGKVGIGTTVPAEKLEIAADSPSDSLFINGPSADTGDIRFRDPSRTPSDFNIDYANGNLRFFTETSPGTGGVERVTISNTGNVGIGTNAPGQRIVVNGTAQATALRLGETPSNKTTLRHFSTGNAACPAGYSSLFPNNACPGGCGHTICAEN